MLRPASRPLWLLGFLACGALSSAAPAAPPAPEGVSFTNDVMAVLSSAGCNRGVCHGNRNGKGGFKLSLRGQDPALDLLALTRDQLGRRTDPLDPERSLILLKPTAQVPHEGGRRFEIGSRPYEILRRWIAAGCRPDRPGVPRLEWLEVAPAEKVLVEPEAELQLRVRARFSGGAERDVSDLAVYEAADPLAAVSGGGRVRFQGPGETTILVSYLHLQAPARLALVPARADFTWDAPPAGNYIDEHVFAKLRRLRLKPSEPAGDSVFLRRAYLDALGILPSAAETRAFLADQRPDKRARWIDGLLERPEFADCWALKWSDLLRNEEKVLDRKGVRTFHDWIRQSIASHKPLDQFARELVSARGSTYANPPANFYRAHRDPLARGEAAAQVFLGVRLQCARCHNHPFDRWTQDDYYRWADCFARVEYKIVENRRRDKNDEHEFDGEQIVWTAREGEMKDPRSGKPLEPRFLGGEAPEPGTGRDRLDELAAWMTSPENPLFAAVQANRIWYHLMGRGIVEPIDDFRATNPPSNPALLEAMAKDFAGHGFDLRHLVRAIMNSRTYQLSAAPNETNRGDETNFSRSIVRRLPAEALLDAFHQVLEIPPEFSGLPSGLRAGQLPGVFAMRSRGQRATTAEQFLKLFGKPPRLLACDCERSGETSMAQACELISGEVVNDLIARPGNVLGRLAATGKPAAAMVEELYWASLGRPPSREELDANASYVTQSTDARLALEDVAWALLNAKEFVLRH